MTLLRASLRICEKINSFGKKDIFRFKNLEFSKNGFTDKTLLRGYDKTMHGSGKRELPYSVLMIDESSLRTLQKRGVQDLAGKNIDTGQDQNFLVQPRKFFCRQYEAPEGCMRGRDEHPKQRGRMSRYGQRSLERKISTNKPNELISKTMMQYGIATIKRRFKIGNMFSKQIFAAGVIVAALASSVYIAPQTAQAAIISNTYYSNTSITIPAGATNIQAVVAAAGGGSETYDSGGYGFDGENGARQTLTLSNSLAGSQINIFVGQGGQGSSGTSAGAGGVGYRAAMSGSCGWDDERGEGYCTGGSGGTSAIVLNTGLVLLAEAGGQHSGINYTNGTYVTVAGFDYNGGNGGPGVFSWPGNPGQGGWVTITYTADTGDDSTRPTVNAFDLPVSAASLTVNVTTFTATDNVGVTGYILTESSSAPSAGAAGWTASAPTSYTFGSAGSKTLYAWAKDTAGNVSLNLSDTVTITLPDATKPVVSAFDIPATATSLTVNVTTFTATDNVGVTGYILTESSSAPSAGAAGWTASAPTSYTFGSAGSKTLYAWAKDTAGNVSLNLSDTVTIETTVEPATTATKIFNQTSWAGGTTSGVPVEPTNRSDWTEFSTSASIDLSTPTSIKVPVPAVTTWTSQSDFENNAATTNSPTVRTNIDTASLGGQVRLAQAKPINIDTQSFHSLALLEGGAVFAWGYNYYGQLGDNTTTNRRTPIQVSGLTGVTAISVGGGHSLALKSDGTVWAWGWNDFGQLGDNTTTNRLTPIQVSGLTGVTAIRAGGSHSLALKSDGTVWAWGRNSSGRLGDNTTTNRLTPIQVSGLTGVTAIRAGGSHSLALKSDGTVWAWGWNAFGRVGDGSETDRLTPVQVSGLTGVTAIGGGGSHSLALKSDGTVWAWGYNYYGQLGDGSTTHRLTPIQVSGLTGVTAISAGGNHSLAILTDGAVKAWGYNGAGQLGDGSIAQRNTPVQVIGLTGVTAIGGAEHHSLAILTDGAVKAWGADSYGQLGNDVTASNSELPVSVATPFVYASSGTIAGLKADVGSGKSVTLAWTNADLPTGTTVKFRSREAASEGGLASATWSAYITAAGTQVSASSLGWVELELTLVADGALANTPIVDSFAITVSPAGTPSLTSSIYDSTSVDSMMSGLRWKEDPALPSGSSVSMRLRTGAATTAMGSWSVPITNASAGCSKDAGTGWVTCGASAIPVTMQDLSGDRYFQYKVELTAGAGGSPTVHEVEAQYYFNVAPQFSATASASQILTSSDANFGKVRVDFAIRDTDSVTNKATTTFEYSTNNGSTWSPLSSNIALYTGAGGATTSPIVVDTSVYTSYYGIWNVAATLPNLNSTTTKLRVTVNDGEAYSSSTVSTTAAFTVDTDAPTGYSITASPINNANKAAASFTFTGAEVGSTYTYIWTSGATKIATGTIASAGQTISGIDLSTLTDGTSTLAVSLRDAAGNQGATTTISVIKDIVAPTGYSITASPINNANKAAASFTFSGAEIGSTYTYIWTSGASKSGTGTIASAGQTISGIDLSTLTDGTSTLAVSLRDAVGNQGATTTISVAKDANAPTGSIAIAGAPQYINNSTVSLNLNGSDTVGVAQMAFSDATMSDDFNNAIVDTVKFYTPTQTGGGTVTEAGGATVATVTGTAYSSGGLTTRQVFGDFDVQVDFSVDHPSAVPSGLALTAILGMGIDADTYLYMRHQKTSAGYEYFGNVRINGVHNLFQSANGMNTFGKLRVQRVGRTVRLYYADGNGPWVLAKEVTGDVSTDIATQNGLYFMTNTDISSIGFTTSFDNFIVWQTPEAYATTKSYTFASGDGPKTAYVRYLDAVLNTSMAYVATTTLDTTPATIASFAPASAYATSTTVSLNLSASDVNGIANILLSNDNMTYSTSTYATTKTWTVTAGDDTKTIYLKVVDNAGNTTSATTTTVILDTTNPTGSISVPTYSTSTAQLTLSATDANGISQMQFANDGGSYSAFEAYATTKSWPLSAGDGQKTVSVKFKDNAGNISAAYSATTTVDSTAPTGTISINADAVIASSTSVTLDLSAADTLSSVSQMQFSTDGSSYSAFEPYTTNKAYTLPSTQGTSTVYVKFKDEAGNESSAYSDMIVLDTVAPSGSLAINGSDAMTASTTVTLYISALDEISTVAQMQLSDNGTDWSAPMAYAAEKAYALSAGDGTKTVFIRFIDAAGNVSTIENDSIILDTINPTGSISVPTYSTSTAQLTLSATDANGISQMQFANDGGAYSAFEPYATTKAWPLSAGDGQKTVSVKFKDNAGNISAAYSATTTVDSTAPTGSISINAGAAIASSTSVTLDLSAADTLSSVSQMQFSGNGTEWSVPETYATTKAYTLPSGDGQKTVYARFIDDAGNVSTSTSDTILLDTSIPMLATDSLLINGNATTDQSETPNVTLSLQNVTGQPEGETVYAQFSRNGSDWYGANANGTVTANEWGTGFASDAETIAGLSWPWTLQTKAETITARIKDGVVEGVSTDENQGTYNIAPVVSSVSAMQQPDATVRIDYALRDADNGTVDTALAYSTDGSNWIALDVDVSGQYGSLSVNGSDTTFTATWDAKATLAGIYDDTVYIRVTANDGELLNNSGIATSSAFVVDAKAPTATGLLIDGSATPVEAEAANVMLAIAGLQGYPNEEEMYAQFSRDNGATWYGYVNGTSTQDAWGDAITASSEFAWTLAGRSETITARTKDIFGNISETVSNQAAYNMRPELAISSAIQATSTGIVIATFEVRDADTFTGSVAPTYQYSVNGGAWNAIDPAQLSVTDANGVAVTDLAVSSAFATYTATWSAKEQFPNAVTNVSLRISVDDAQPIKNIGTATSSIIVIDAKAPTVGVDSFLINDSSEIAVASSRDVTFKLQNVTGNPTDETIQARFSRDNGATWSSWSAPFATDAATLAATTFPWTMAGRSETLLVSIRDIFGNESETTDENGAGYNLRPQIVSGPTAEQITDQQNADYGKVVINYTVKDEDTNEGSTPGQVTPTIAYSTDGGVTWTEIASSSASLMLASGIDGMQPIAASDTILSAAWDAKADLGATYNQNMEVRLTINDNEGIFNLATATSSIFSIDTTDPVIVSATYNGVTQRVDFHMTDEAAFQYRIASTPFTATTSATTTENANDGVWQDANASVNMSREWIVTATTTAPTVYVQARDTYGNTTEKTVLAPLAPARVDFKDNSTGENYIEFISWPVYTSVGGAQFKQYDLYRAADGGEFAKIGSSITTRSTNYRTDENLSAGVTYAYKVAVIDTDNDVSLFSAPISDIPDGRGSSDALPPIITNVAATEVQSLWAKIAWTTDEEADSTVEYGTSAAYGLVKTSDAMAKRHEVILNELTPNTSYFFKVASKDAGNNEASDDNSAAGYLFTTPGGPVITGVTASSSDKTATISWMTDKDSDSHVFYSKNNAFNGYSEAVGTAVSGSTSTAYVHSLTLNDLEPGSTYYYYVQSATAEGNASLDNNGGMYYTFRTSNDIYPPVISGIATPIRTSQSAVVFWKTNEPATSQVNYGTGTSSLTLSSDYDSTLSTYHSVTLDDLAANTTYQFNVASLDLAGNRGISTTTSFTTTKEGEVKVITVGGGSTQAPTEKDTTPPTISSIEVATTTAFGATITFDTSEPAISTVQYGRGAEYGDVAGEKDYATKHTIRLNGLKMGTEYHFQVQARDKAGNAAASTDATFKTKFFSQASTDLKTIENLQQYEEEVEQSIESILPGILPPFVEEARVTDVTENSATVFWRTNVRSYGVVAYGTEEEFAKATSKATAYTGEVSDTNAKTLEHTLQLIGLKPNTKYHFKTKAFSLPQVVGEGNDLTFVTKAPKVSASIIDVKNTSFRVIWSTDTPASTIVEYKNIRTGITERIIDEKPVAYHDILVERVLPGASYEVRVFGYAASGALIESGAALSVLTSRDIAAPKITNFKVDGALVPGRTDRVQTVVTWTTDESSNSTVYYQEGAGQVTKDFANKAEQLDAYTTNHAIILSNLKPGTIYQMKIESVDAAGNKASFGPRTIITPQKGESIFDVIFKNFEDTFKFLRAAGQ